MEIIEMPEKTADLVARAAGEWKLGVIGLSRCSVEESAGMLPREWKRKKWEDGR